jgi:hypothetical protein
MAVAGPQSAWGTGNVKTNDNEEKPFAGEGRCFILLLSRKRLSRGLVVPEFHINSHRRISSQTVKINTTAKIIWHKSKSKFGILFCLKRSRNSSPLTGRGARRRALWHYCASSSMLNFGESSASFDILRQSGVS